ncbi:AAA-domain-containing protein [Ceratobasidium sp. AG-I]|nr:AAA-domain-containing protein [Ceratobasidium sp. AG-I]
MRALSVARRRALRPAPVLQSVSSAPFSSSKCNALPRSLPPDFPRRAAPYAQASIDDTHVSPGSARVEIDDAQGTPETGKPRKRLGRPSGSPNKPPSAPPPTARAAVGPEAIWSGRALGEDEARALPPDDILQDALSQLLVTLQPQTQYRAAYTTNGVPLTEPTMALYCPIEGGDHVIDDTVKELANRVNADVIVIDAAQLAAGEYGNFGKAASVLNFPHNPLHFTSSPSFPSRSVSEDPDQDDDDDMDDDNDVGGESDVQRVMFGNVSAYAVPFRTLRLRNAPNPFAPPSPSSSSSTTSPRSVPTAQSELKHFFESIINAPIPAPSGSTPIPGRARVIYIRDFTLLAPSAPSWYPALLAAIRSRRQGPLLRPNQPISSPTTLVLGVSPSLVPSSSPARPSLSPPSGLMGMLMGQRPGGARVIRAETILTDDRASRLRDRLKRWARSGSVLDDLPAFVAPGSASSPKSGFMTANGFNSVFGSNPSSAGMLGLGATGGDGASVGSGNKSGYFRVCGVVPAVRDEAREKAVRKARRVEVNALVVRMAVGSVGGRVVGGSMVQPVANGGAGKGGKSSKKDVEEKQKETSSPALASGTGELDPDKMTDDWSRRILDWPSARRLADRALACAVLASPAPNPASAETSSKGNIEVIIKPDGTEPSALLETVEQTSSGVLIPPSGSVSTATSDSTSPRPGSTPEVGLPVPTSVPWDAVRAAWDAVRLSLGYGQEPSPKTDKDNQADDSNRSADPAPTPSPSPSAAAPASAPTPDASTPSSPPKWSGIGSPREPVLWLDAALHQEPVVGVGKPPEPGQADEVVERVKSDPELDTHEERLLGCIVNPAELQTTFAQVHLPDPTIDSVRTLVSLPLLYPAAFRSGILAQHAMTGALLFGPPGTGKTLVAKALAKESGARMMVVKPSDVMDMYVGEGEKLVRSVFSLARRLSPCIVFLDEIDALLGARSSRDTGGAASAHRGLVTEFMQEMDGLRSSASSNVVVVGATNRPFDLDDAVLRRLPRRLLIDLPGEAEREAILRIMFRGENIDADVDVKGLAKRTEGFSGSDLKNLVVAAALDAVKENVEVPWRTKKDKEDVKVVEVSSEIAASVAPDATSSDTPVPGTQTTPVEPARKSPDTPNTTSSSNQALVLPTPAPFTRILSERHFARALKEITPSASEALGTLSDLRKWNAEFGGGERKKLHKAWGGRFGFGGSGKKEGPEEGSGRVGGVAP